MGLQNKANRKTKRNIREETHLTTPSRLEGKAKNAGMYSPKKKRVAKGRKK